MSLTETQSRVQNEILNNLQSTRSVRRRRVFDIIIAGLALVLASPVIIAVVWAIWLETGRPFLFSQMRLGYRGKQFRIYKFRKFYPENTSPGCPLTVKNDGRMTPVGRFLEKSKLDELPQLWNVLRGDMSLVGPRPETPNFKDCFEKGFSRVLEFRPGILGPSQAFFRNESSLYPEGVNPVAYYRAVLFPLKAKIDLEYYPNGSLASDIGWIARCFLAVFGLSSNCPSKLLMTVRGKKHWEAPASWRIADHNRRIEK